MNNLKVYNNLCRSRQCMSRSKKNGYYESHHINPKWLGGDDSSDNLVLLTAREHYLAHYLLFNHYRDRSSAAAFHIMNNSCNMTHRDSKKYEEVRVFQSEKMRGSNNPAKRMESRIKISEGVSGIKNGMFGRTGNSNPFYGKTHSEDFLNRKMKLHGHPLIFRGVSYHSLRQAMRETGVSRYLIKKEIK